MTTLFILVIVLSAIGVFALSAWIVADRIAERLGRIEFADLEFATDAGFEASLIRRLPEVERIARRRQEHAYAAVG